MTDLPSLRSPLSFSQGRIPKNPHRDLLAAEEDWWKSEGVAISNDIDRGGTPWLRMFDRDGKRVDEILYPREYQTTLTRRYPSAVVYRHLQLTAEIQSWRCVITISLPRLC